MGSSRLKKERVGEISHTVYGDKIKIVEYRCANDIIIEFENGHTCKTNYNNFIKGQIKNYYHKNIYNVGYIGKGGYKSHIGGKRLKESTIWRGMLGRCYSSKFQETHLSYKGCSVCDEWLNFQGFSKWFSENYYEINGHNIQLDKDILIKGNKIYSPETCIFVPQSINLLFIKPIKNSRTYPLGVYIEKNTNKYTSMCGNGKKVVYLGQYTNSIDAFNAYKNYKENLIKETAEKWKSQIPEKLYNALMKYEVEITD